MKYEIWPSNRKWCESFFCSKLISPEKIKHGQRSQPSKILYLRHCEGENYIRGLCCKSRHWIKLCDCTFEESPKVTVYCWKNLWLISWSFKILGREADCTGQNCSWVLDEVRIPWTIRSKRGSESQGKVWPCWGCQTPFSSSVHCRNSP